MKVILYSIFILSWGFCLHITAQGLNRSQQSTLNIGSTVKRIVFLGNSITWQGSYINDIELYLTANYPDRPFELINVGLPSETVSGLSEPGHAGGAFARPDLHERLERILTQTRPDLVFACYGINDGIYMPLDTERFQKFKEGINWMHQEVVKSGARIIHITPPVYDELKGGSKGYSSTIDHYADWLLGLKASQKWEVIDIHYPMKSYLEAHRKVDATYALDGFSLAADGVHPSEVGHWIMAKEILLYLGCKEIKKSTGPEPGKISNGVRILKLVTGRQNMMRDAWLTATKYKRPGLPPGLPITEAQAISEEMKHEIWALVKNKKIAEVYLVGGQSNATGQGYIANMPDTMKFNKGILMFHSGAPHLDSGLPPFTWQLMHQASESPDRFGPELGFASKIKQVVPGAQITLIKHAHSGTNLYEDWNPGNDEQDSLHEGLQYKEFIKTVDAGMDSLRNRGYEPIVRGMLWQQGENDATATDSISALYGIKLKHFVARVREHIQAGNMAFIFGYVCPPPLNGRGIKTVRQAEHDLDQDAGTSLSVRRAFIIPTDDLSRRARDRNTRYPGDELHFGTDGIWVLGLRMAEKMNAVLSQ